MNATQYAPDFRAGYGATSRPSEKSDATAAALLDALMKDAALPVLETRYTETFFSVWKNGHGTGPVQAFRGAQVRLVQRIKTPRGADARALYELVGQPGVKAALYTDSVTAMQ